MRHTHYKPISIELRNHEWCGTAMSLDSEHTEIPSRVTCNRCLKKMAHPPKPRKPKTVPVGGDLTLLFDDTGSVYRVKLHGTAAQKFWEELRTGAWKKGKKT